MLIPCPNNGTYSGLPGGACEECMNTGYIDVVADSAFQWDEELRGPRMSEVTTGRTIFKYQMPVLEQFYMDLPAGAEIIRMADQGGMFWMWAVVGLEAPIVRREFRAFKTGAQMPSDVKMEYRGFCAVYVQMELGLYIFEVIG